MSPDPDTDFFEDLGIEMILVKGGIFLMGNDDSDFDEDMPAHQVRLSNYYIGKYPITQIQWQAVMGTNPSSFHGCDQCPVELVSWDDVQVFLTKLNERYPGKNYRLPTEAEWEYAARGGQLSKRYQYAGSNELEEVGWYGKNSNGTAHPVGQKQANELGIYDMSGNVCEWCQDKFNIFNFDTYYQRCYDKGIVHNPQGPSEGKFFVLRGGSWLKVPSLCRVFSRVKNAPPFQCLSTGIRCARDL